MDKLDTSLKKQTPEGIEYTLFPAGITVRACAWGIDCIIRGIVMLALIISISVTSRFLGIWFFLIVNFALDWFYYVVFELIWNGQSPGKRILGIRVVSGDGTPVKPGASFLRNLLRFADGFFYLYLFAFISMAISSGFRRFGDWAADTLVIYTARSRLPGRFIPPYLMKQEAVSWLSEIPAVVSKKRLSFEEKQGLLLFARRYPLLGKKRADEIAHSWAAVLMEDENDPSIADSRYLLGIARTISGINYEQLNQRSASAQNNLSGSA